MAEFVEMKTSELKDAALDWMVAEATGQAKTILRGKAYALFGSLALPFNDPEKGYSPSSCWHCGGPVFDSLEGMKIQNNRIVRNITAEKLEHWYNSDPNAYRGWSVKLGHDFGAYEGRGSSLLIAMSRAIVAAKLGVTVSVPRELLPC